MITGYVADQVRRANRNLLVTNVVMLGICVGVLVVSLPYIMECLRGPFAMTPAEIAALGNKNEAPHRFLRVTIDPDDLDGGTYHITGGSEKKNDHYNFLHVSGGRYLIIKADRDDIPHVLEGTLMEPDSDVNGSVISWANENGNVKGTVLPVVLSVEEYRTGMYAEFFFCGLFGLWALWNIAKAVMRRGNLESHPSVKQLKHLGPPEEIAVAVDAEVKMGTDKVGGVITTQSWLINPTYFGVTLVYLGDIAWLYKKETKHKSYGVTTRTSYATVIYDVRGKNHEFSLNQAQVDGLLRSIASKVPWAFVGFSAELQNAWKKNRKEVLGKVEERKKIVMAQNAAAPPVQGG